MRATAEVIQLNDARRARIQQFTVILSSLVAFGDGTNGLITCANNPNVIAHIQQSLSNPDFATLGHLREEVVQFGGRENSRWMEIGPFLVFYSVCRNKNQLEIESVSLRHHAAPDPRSPKLNGRPSHPSVRSPLPRAFDRRRRLLCVAAVVLLAVTMPCVYFLMRHAFSREHVSLALIKRPTESTVVLLNSNEERRSTVALPTWMRTVVLPGSLREFKIAAWNRLAVGWENAELFDVISNRFTSSDFLIAEGYKWDNFDKRSISSVPFVDEAVTAAIPVAENTGLLPQSVAGGEPNFSVDDGPTTQVIAQKDRPYLLGEGRLNCEKSKVKAVYLCSLVVGSHLGKNTRKELIGRLHLSESDNDGLDLTPRRTSFQIDVSPPIPGRDRFGSLVGAPDPWKAKGW
jgi:hypothetical protein